MHLCEVRIFELCDISIVFVKASCRGSLLNTLTLFQVMVNSTAISTSAGVYAAPATGFSSNPAASSPANVTTAVPPQTAVQPVIVSPLSIGRPGRVYILWLSTWMSYIFGYIFPSTAPPPPFLPHLSKTNVKRLWKKNPLALSENDLIVVVTSLLTSCFHVLEGTVAPEFAWELEVSALGSPLATFSHQCQLFC